MKLIFDRKRRREKKKKPSTTGSKNDLRWTGDGPSPYVL